MDYVLAMDTSYYQDNNNTSTRPDFKKAYANGVRISIHRAVFANKKDEDFDYNWQAAADAGMFRSAYGFIDYRATAPRITDQGKAMVEALYKDPGEIPVQWGDFEKPNSSWPLLPSRDKCLTILTEWFGVVDAGLQRTSGLYGNRETINALTPVPAKTLMRKLWIAGWPYIPAGETPEVYCKTLKPTFSPWETWTFWQFTAHGDGKKYGMESGNVDLDWFNGTEAELRAWVGAPVVVEPEYTDAEKLDILWRERQQKVYLPIVGS